MMIDRNSGSIAVDVTGSGPLVVCVPGMGESKASFRHLTPLLVNAGYRVAVMDLRGHGDSSTEFSTYDDSAAASDIIELIDALEGAPATIIGNSMGAAAAVLVAAQRPEIVNRLVLIGPFLRDHSSQLVQLLMRAALSKPWGPWVWRSYYRSLFGQTVPPDHDEHTRSTLELLRRPGRWKAFQKTSQTSHSHAEASLPKVSAPTLVIMGEVDRDFKDPESEAKWAAETLHGEYRMMLGAGHYPMGEQPKAVFTHLLPFLRRDENKQI